jgi:hypothetical protein
MQKDIYKISKKTIYKVVVFHILLIGIISIDFKSSNKKIKSLTVKNIIVEPQIKQKGAVQTKIVNKQAPIKKQAAKQEVKQEKKIVKKDIKKTAAPIPNKLLENLEKSLAKLDANEKKEVHKEDLYIPKEIKKVDFDIKPIESRNENSDFNFSAVLIKELKENLILPEYGSVKVVFSINSIGKIYDVEILEYKSEKNKSYLKNNLPKLQLKCLQSLDKMKQNYIAVFKNE